MSDTDVATPSALHMTLLRRLVQHLEHHSGAGIVYLFSDYLLADRWLLYALNAQGVETRSLAPSSAGESVATLLDPLFAAHASNHPAPVFSLVLNEADAAFNELREQVLARLNENRAFLELNQLFVLLLLPPNFEQRAAEVAPDLWSVRSASYEMPSWAAQSQEWANETSQYVALSSSISNTKQNANAIRSLPSDALKRRWAQQWKTWQDDSTKPLSGALAHHLAGQYLQHHRPKEAEPFAAQALTLARHRIKADGKKDPTALRELVISLGLVGWTLLRSGYATRAQHIFEENLDITRSLVETIGENPQTLRDLSVSLENVGEVKQELGNPNEAQSYYQEALYIDERIVEIDHHSLQSLRDLSITQNKLGRIASDLGDLKQAQTMFERSLAIIEQLTTTTEIKTDLLHDSIALLTDLAHIDQRLGRLQAARTALAKALSISQQLAELEDSNPQAIRDTSIILESVGDVELASNELIAAQRAYEECLRIRRDLAESAGNYPRNLQDISAALRKIGHIARARSALDTARNAFEESLAIDRTVVALAGNTRACLHDLRMSLNNVGDIARIQGRLQDARNAYQEALDISQELANYPDKTLSNLVSLALTFRKLGAIAKDLDDTQAAWSALQESIRIGRTIDWSRNSNGLKVAYQATIELVQLAQETGKIEEAKGLLDEVEELSQHLGKLTESSEQAVQEKDPS